MTFNPRVMISSPVYTLPIFLFAVVEIIRDNIALKGVDERNILAQNT